MNVIRRCVGCKFSHVGRLEEVQMGSKEIELCGKMMIERVVFDNIGLSEKVCSLGSSPVVCAVRCV